MIIHRKGGIGLMFSGSVLLFLFVTATLGVMLLPAMASAAEVSPEQHKCINKEVSSALMAAGNFAVNLKFLGVSTSSYRNMDFISFFRSSVL